MADLLIRPVPLPVNRPSGLDYEYQPYIDSRMPLEATEKAADAFSGVGSYHPSLDPVNPLYGLVMAFKEHIEKIHYKVVQTGENMAEMINQLQTGYLDGPVTSNNFIANFIEFTIYSGLAIGIIALGYLGFLGVRKIYKEIRKIW